jgi:PHD/YefM family antitoxin component YafN of YafNO toxin-antitoxin module
MTVGTLKVGKREFVVLPRREYERLAARLAEDARDARLAKAALAHYRKTGQGATLEELERKYGG